MSSRYIRHNHTPPEDLEPVGRDILDALVTNIRFVRKRTFDRQTQLGGGVYIGTAGKHNKLEADLARRLNG
jgi:hypothetical protein